MRSDFEVDVNLAHMGDQDWSSESEIACSTQSTLQPKVQADPPKLSAQSGAVESHTETVLGTVVHLEKISLERSPSSNILNAQPHESVTVKTLCWINGEFSGSPNICSGTGVDR